MARGGGSSTTYPTPGLAAVLDAAPVGVALLDRELRFRFANDVMTGLLAEAGADHLGRPVGELLPELPPEVLEALGAALEGERTFNLPVTLAQRHFEAGCYPVRDAEDEDIAAAALVLRETTQDVQGAHLIEHLIELAGQLAGARTIAAAATAGLDVAATALAAQGGAVATGGPRPHVLAATGLADEPLTAELQGAIAEAEERGSLRVEPAEEGSDGMYVSAAIARPGDRPAVLSLRLVPRRWLTEPERAFLRAAAEQCRLAFERARADEASVLARERAEQFAALTARLNGAADAPGIAAAALDAVSMLGAARGIVMRVDDAGDLRVLSQSGYGDDVLTAYHHIPAGAHIPPTTAVRERRILLLESPQALREQYPAEVEEALRAGSRAWASVPMLRGDTAVGVLHLGYDAEHAFAPEEAQALETVAGICAEAFTRALLHEEEHRLRQAADAARAELSRLLGAEQAARVALEQVMERVTQLEHVTEAALSRLSLDDLLQDLLTRLSEALHVDHAAVLLPGESGALTVRASRGFGGLLAEGEEESSGLAVRVAAEARAIAIEDTAAAGLPGSLAGTVRSLVAVPLVADGAQVGVLQAGSTEPRRFPTSDIGLLERAAHRAALAIRNAELYERAESERLRLAAIMRQLPAGVAIVEGAEARIVQANPRARAILPLPPRGEPWPWAQELIAGGPAEDLVLEAVRADGSDGHVRVSLRPVEGAGTPITVVTIMDETEQKQAEEVARFLADATELMSRTLDPEEAIARIVALAVPRMGDWCAISLVHDEQLRAAAVAHAEPERREQVSEALEHRGGEPDPGIIAAVVRTGAARMVSRISATGAEELGGLAGLPGLRSLIVVPLTARGRTFGAITLGAESERRYSPRDLELVGDLARRAALAFDNAVLHARERFVRRRAELLGHTAHRLASAATQGDVARVLMKSALEAVSADAAWVGLVRGSTFELIAQSGFPAEVVRDLRSVPMASRPELTATARDGEPRWWESRAELLASHPQLPARWRAHYEAYGDIPIPGPNAPLGSVSVLFREARPIEPDQRELLTALAALSGPAFERAALYERERAAARLLQHSLLPAELPTVPGLRVASIYEAAGEGNQVGGDFYDVWRYGDGACIAVGDVSGKGPAAAALTGLARHTIRTAALHDPDPGQVLRVLNDAVRTRTNQEQFLTVAYAHLSPTADGFLARYAAAGHPPPVLVHADGTVERLEWRAPVAGVFDTIRDDHGRITLRHGDLLVIITDGVADRRHEGEFFGEARAIELAQEHRTDPAGAAEAIRRAVLAFAPSPPQDDFAVVAVLVE